ncbi:LCP family protein [Fusibacter sp. 3D3]|uniref:LCP family protein n=1 Tax=Fusibacter sp. 3D3 TaxID=1048380 RepID=UPI000853E96D|nr:LCP family protein [Fusibacter sp. 3D3]GAU76129.1 cell envelope-associated transcriptionalattenuator LytR-CpsA-Psr [Fusibacter sp. 3D3]
MKFYIKLFVISFICFTVVIAGTFFAIEKNHEKSVAKTPTEGPASTTPINVEPEKLPVEEDNRTELQKIAESSNRVNVLAFGLNDSLADTMMFISFDPDTQKLDILSIPRDTYHPVEGHNNPGQKKMNAVYGMKEVGGVNGMKKYLSEFLGVPIDYYVRIDFKAVQAVVDVLGGYEVKVPFDMDYDDSWATPELHIHIKAGLQTLSGSETVKFLRFRQNNSKTISEGDIQRIPRQQAFVNSMIKKALSAQLPSVMNTIINSNYIKTDMTIEKALGYAVKAAGMKSDQISFYVVEGEGKRISGLDYWIHDPAALENTMFKIYGLEKKIEEPETEPEAEKEKTPETNSTN